MVTKIDVFSGFLGAGKTTLIKKLLSEAYKGEKIVLVENEFGEIGIDGGFMQDVGIQVTEMNSGCICCSLTGDFRVALRDVKEKFSPDRILIEPSGVGKLSDVIAAVESTGDPELVVNGIVAVVDATRIKAYLKNFGEFYENQIVSAGCLVLSRTGNMTEEKIAQAEALLKEKNPGAAYVTTSWDKLSGEQILAAMERRDTLEAALTAMRAEHEDDDDDDECDDPECSCHHHHHEEDGEEHEHHHHHHHHHEDGEECDDPECSCHHHHDDDDDDEDEHEHHHHDHDHDHEGHEHHHHHHHHHGHDADEVFSSWGIETARRFTEDELREKLAALTDEARFGMVLRAKGIVDSGAEQWFHFDYTPGESEIRTGSAAVTGRLCVIGSGLKEEAVAELFR